MATMASRPRPGGGGEKSPASGREARRPLAHLSGAFMCRPRVMACRSRSGLGSWLSDGRAGQLEHSCTRHIARSIQIRQRSLGSRLSFRACPVRRGCGQQCVQHALRERPIESASLTPDPAGRPSRDAPRADQGDGRASCPSTSTARRPSDTRISSATSAVRSTWVRSLPMRRDRRRPLPPAILARDRRAPRASREERHLRGNPARGTRVTVSASQTRVTVTFDPEAIVDGNPVSTSLDRRTTTRRAELSRAPDA